MKIAPLSGPLGAEVWGLDQNPLAEVLAARFPGVHVVRGDARALPRVLERNQVGPVKAVGSSLPLLNLSAREPRAA